MRLSSSHSHIEIDHNSLEKVCFRITSVFRSENIIFRFLVLLYVWPRISKEAWTQRVGAYTSYSFAVNRGSWYVAYFRNVFLGGSIDYMVLSLVNVIRVEDFSMLETEKRVFSGPDAIESIDFISSDSRLNIQGANRSDPGHLQESHETQATVDMDLAIFFFVKATILLVSHVQGKYGIFDSTPRAIPNIQVPL
ncbi:uncharacterized protein BDR25DRAFT_352857 [Lindgomyces ingoldianus]|uniref:Uncharacterized protein n=1 Tax=Lindgomyces ingoldianus TaxID=673940 RepID=A0ACB6R2D4_9PLEO|nr:uncharacterized protein BDR25DRAFT_352857 [Lindgomyces ingoldianus]KAF2473433.1 hypothetical protein BDR25DRAFT_352857 [Lindgomyces ingoldianus]